MSPQNIQKARRLISAISAAQKELDKLFNPIAKTAKKPTLRDQYEASLVTGKYSKPRL